MKVILPALALIAVVFAGCNAPDAGIRAGDPLPPSALGHVLSVTTDWDVPPKLLSGSAPIYPLSHVLDGKDGEAKLEFTVDETGRTTDIRVVEATYKYFGSHAAIAVRGWRYSPAMKDGKPVRVRVEETFHFTVNNPYRDSK